jgi:transcriptional regulator with XRE-family HTH domain
MTGGIPGSTPSDLPALMQARRLELGKSQRDVADELKLVRATFDRSEWRKWESGKVVPGRYWLPHIAEVLELPIGVLRAAKAAHGGPAPDRIDPPAGVLKEDQVLRRRDLLVGTAGLSIETALFRPTGTTEATATLRFQVIKAQAEVRDARYASLGRRLPGLLDRAQAAGDPVVAADAWSLSTEYLIKVNNDDLALITSDRAAAAAAASEDPLTIAGAQWGRCIALRHSGRSRTAYTIVADAAAKLADETGLATAEQLGTYGHLFLCAGYTAASSGDAARAEDYMAEAEATAGRFSTDRAYGMWYFGPAQAGLYRLSTEYALGNIGGALDAARRVKPAQLPSAERRARYWIDLARVYGLDGDQTRLAGAIHNAYAAAPAEVTTRPVVRELARSAGIAV